jgi:hypothetical protein
MNARLRFAISLASVLAISAVLAGCGKSGGAGVTAPGMGTVRIGLTDAPASFDSVVIVVREVSIHRGDSGTDDSGWEIVRPDSVAAYDLLTLRNGVFMTLGTGLVPAGHYTQVRLKLAPGSYVVTGGAKYLLTVPSGLQSGYKLVGEFDVPAGGEVDLGLDFDAARSIHVTGNGKYMLKPTVRVFPIGAAGAIDGTLSPGSDEAQVFAISGADTVASAIPGGDGHFLVSLLPAGSYDVAVDAQTGLRDTTLTGIGVTPPSTTHLGTITLTPQP